MEATYSPKRLLNFSGLYGVVSQKIELFITSAVRTSNLACSVEYTGELAAYQKVLGNLG
jgi:hypothetical protein